MTGAVRAACGGVEGVLPTVINGAAVAAIAANAVKIRVIVAILSLTALPVVSGG